MKKRDLWEVLNIFPSNLLFSRIIRHHIIVDLIRSPYIRSCKINVTIPLFQCNFTFYFFKSVIAFISDQIKACSNSILQFFEMLCSILYTQSQLNRRLIWCDVKQFDVRDRCNLQLKPFMHSTKWLRHECSLCKCNIILAVFCASCQNCKLHWAIWAK